MSGKRNVPNDGQALTTPDVQRIGDNAAAMDDRVYENLMTPPSLGAKTIDPLGIETSTYNPRLICVPGVANGTVQLQPCSLRVGSPSIALGVALQKTVQTALASALFGANASGATRYDLVYATLQRTVTLTGARAIKSTADGSIAVNPSVNLQDEPSLTLTILPNVGNVTPLATMPADNNGGANGEPFGSYNFPIALVALPNGYASAGAITQAMITPLWSAGYVHAHRVRGVRPASFYYGAANERPSSVLSAAVQGAERWGAVRPFFAHFKMLPTTAAIINGGLLLDNTIDWRNRFVWGFYSYLSISGNALPLEGTSTASMAIPQSTASGANSPVDNTGVVPPTWTGPGGAGVNGSPSGFLRYTDSTGTVYGNSPWGVRQSDGALMIERGTLIDGANGDVLVLVLYATDQLLPTV